VCHSSSTSSWWKKHPEGCTYTYRQRKQKKCHKLHHGILWARMDTMVQGRSDRQMSGPLY
jgi:hypothetical protein